MKKLLIVPTILLWGASIWAATPSTPAENRISREVGHQLRGLPYYSIFDDLRYEVNGNKVTLLGKVTRPTLKTDAENAVKSIEGIGTVTNKIEVLPLSGFDDDIRLAAYRAIYGNSSLNHYGLNASPPIHIVVENGNVELVGVVSTELDRNLAGAQVNSVAGVHSVKNSLRVSKD